ncbi:MAG: OsmC family protein [Gemmatimonadota bacterium]
MPVRNASATWSGALMDGEGTMRLGTGAFEGAYSAGTRFGEEPGTNPEELIGAAHAGCFSMALAHVLDQAGHSPERIDTSARVHIEKQDDGFAITLVELDTTGVVAGIDEATFRESAEQAKANCPVSQALAATEIRLAGARLES